MNEYFLGGIIVGTVITIVSLICWILWLPDEDLKMSLPNQPQCDIHSQRSATQELIVTDQSARIHDVVNASCNQMMTTLGVVKSDMIDVGVYDVHVNLDVKFYKRKR